MVRDFPKSPNQPNEMALTICNSIFLPRRIGSSSQSASRSECESLCHVFNYFFAWSRILYIFTSLFSCWIWCYGARKGKMYFFIMSSLLLPNFEGKEKVWNSRKSAYLWCIFFKTVGALLFVKNAYPKTPLTQFYVESLPKKQYDVKEE